MTAQGQRRCSGKLRDLSICGHSPKTDLLPHLCRRSGRKGCEQELDISMQGFVRGSLWLLQRDALRHHECHSTVQQVKLLHAAAKCAAACVLGPDTCKAEKHNLSTSADRDSWMLMVFLMADCIAGHTHSTGHSSPLQCMQVAPNLCGWKANTPPALCETL